MEIFVWAILIGLIPAVIAQGKGRSFVLWWIYGAALFIIALPHSLIMKVNTEKIENRQINDGMKKCPYCAEMVKSEAIKCKHCGADIKPEPTSAVKHNERVACSNCGAELAKGEIELCYPCSKKS